MLILPFKAAMDKEEPIIVMEHVLCEQSPVLGRMLAEEWKNSGQSHDTLRLEAKEGEDPVALKTFGKRSTNSSC